MPSNLMRPHFLDEYKQKRKSAEADEVDMYGDSRGLGFILRQQNKDGSWNVVQAGSRFLSDAETRYAMIELECLAAAWAMRKCR